MAMQSKRIGNKEIQAQFGFVHVDPATMSENKLYNLLRNILLWEKERINEGVITSFLAFVEGTHTGALLSSRAVTRTFDIDGEVRRVSVRDVQDLIAEKRLHASPAFRKAGNKSTHPPRFLKSTMLALVFGSRQFLMENVHLYLEEEGLLRMHTFDLIKEVALLESDANSENYYHVDIAHQSFYRGNIETLGKLAGIKGESDEHRLSTSELMQRLKTTT